MSDQLAKLRKLTGQLQKLTYEAVKSGTMAELSEEEQPFARVATIVVAVGNRAKIEPGLKDLKAGEIKLVK